MSNFVIVLRLTSKTPCKNFFKIILVQSFVYRGGWIVTGGGGRPLNENSRIARNFLKRLWEFQKKKFRRLLDNLKFEILLIFQYHSKQNGFMEKKISPLKKSLRQLFINKVDLSGHQLGHAMFCRTKNRSSLFGKHVRKRVGDPFLRTYLEKLYS